MFFHVYKYRLKTLFRQRVEFFWILLFPIILAICFHLAFSGITESTENFEAIPVAMVAEDTTDNQMFLAMMDALHEQEFFRTEICDNMDDANKLLDSEKVLGIIQATNGTPALTIKQNGIYETMIALVLDSYKQQVDVIANLAASPSDIPKIINDLNQDDVYLVTDPLTSGNTDCMVEYFYALIAMACMFGTMTGTSCIKDMKANLSALGMRRNLTSTKYFTMILGDFFGIYTIHATSDVILVIFLKYILNVGLGGSFLLILLVALFGSLIGISVGFLIGSMTRFSENMRMGISICFSLFSSFLSGLMVNGIKNSIEKACPVINRLNPSSLISDCLYSLNIYDNYDVYISRLSIMVIMSIILCVASCIIIRRETYDSL